MLADFHFLRPEWFWVLIPWLLLLFRQMRYRMASSAWQKVADGPLLEWLGQQNATHKNRVNRLLILAMLGGVIAVIALAGPVWERQPQPVMSASHARVLVMDLSRSMLATDQKPSRLEQARFKMEDILNRIREGQTGLVAYAGEAFVISPLTDDNRTILALLPALAPDIMPVQGARADLAVQQAAELMHQAGENEGEILLITDGVNSDRLTPVVEGLYQSGIRVSVLAVGTKQGAPIALPDGGFAQDRNGDIVIPQLDQQALRAIARAGGGRYSQLRVDGRDLDVLLPDENLEDVEQNTAFTEDGNEVNSELWKEQGPWFVLLLLPLSALAFRRGWLFCCCLLPSLLLHPGSAEAAWKDWWKTPAQQTREALDQNDHEGALTWTEQLAGQPLLAGESYYRNGDFEGAESAFKRAVESATNPIDAAEGAYNLGNTLAQLERFDEAITAYEDALEQVPGMQDALENLELLKSLQEQEQDQQEGDQGEEGDEQEQDQEQEQEQEQEEQQQDGEQDSDQQEQQSEQQSEEESSEQTDEDQQSDEQPEESDEEQSEEQSEEQQADEGEESEQEAEQQPVELSEEEAEQQRAVEQWLRRITDDPGGLLRNKFRFQYQQRQRNSNDSDEEEW